MGIQWLPLAAEFGDASFSPRRLVMGPMRYQSAAQISIVLPTDTIETIKPVLGWLHHLALGERLEIVLVVPESEGPASGQLDQADRIHVQLVPSVYPLSSARVAGIRAATAPYVFMGETHSFPDPGMFEALLERHSAGATVAIPVFANANPQGLVSWAGFLNGYAEWTDGVPAQALSYAPLYNASYLRSFLIGLGDDLEHSLTPGGDMMAKLRAAGCTAWIEPKARIAHWNIARIGDWLPQRFVAGRVIASLRSQKWPVFRRLAFAIGAPLIPLVLFARVRSGIMRTIRRNDVSLAVIPALALGMIVQAAGEMIGYIAGASPKGSRIYDEYEVRQLSFTSWSSSSRKG